jgi:hypothetical protein
MSILKTPRFQQRKEHHILMFFSTIFLMISLVNTSDVNLYLPLGLACGTIWSLLVIIQLTNLNNFDFFTVGAAFYILFGYGGFLYAWQTITLPSVISIMGSMQYVFTEIDIIYAALYSNFFCLVFITLPKFLNTRKILNKTIYLPGNRIHNIKNQLFLYSFAIIAFKVIMIVSGQQKMSFLTGQEELQFGDQSTMTQLFSRAISPTSSFLIGIISTLSIIKKNSEKNDHKIYILFLLIDFFFAFSLGRRPLIYHVLIFAMGALVAINSSSTLQDYQNYAKNKVKIFLATSLFVVLFFGLIKSLTFTRLIVENAAEMYDIVNITSVIQMFASQDLSSISSANEVASNVEKNLSVRNAFTLSYVAQFIHGLFIYQNIAFGSILTGSFLTIFPSALTFLFDKSKNLQGEFIIGQLINSNITDGANTLVAFSLADFYLLGPLVYTLVVFLILVSSFEILNLIILGIDTRDQSLLHLVFFSGICYFFISMAEADFTDLLQFVRSILIVAIIYKIISSTQTWKNKNT